eukprot:Rmarinus@m.24865
MKTARETHGDATTPLPCMLCTTRPQRTRGRLSSRLLSRRRLSLACSLAMSHCVRVRIRCPTWSTRRVRSAETFRRWLLHPSRSRLQSFRCALPAWCCGRASVEVGFAPYFPGTGLLHGLTGAPCMSLTRWWLLSLPSSHSLSSFCSTGRSLRTMVISGARPWFF